ncbi:MAG: DUF2889 domain-containing protein [Deltaproteobacteria bacterium]|nr:DUF2889 domain-containing protein [Deltaproteobacteria bacterium]MBW2361345.1 DUF2889 domain-containing protein [Deltaproteobacteria bacterium]
MSGDAVGDSGNVTQSLPRTPYQPYGTGIYRRELCVRVLPGFAVGELVDDMHHFRATVSHDGERVTDAVGEAVRAPWTTCPEVMGLLERLRGMPLEGSMLAAGRYASMRAQCTHLFDAAALAIARVGRGAGDVRYRIAVPDRRDGCSVAEIARDGQPVFAWQLREQTIESPAPFAGRRISGAGFARWAEQALDADAAEAALVLQRAAFISIGRSVDVEDFRRASDIPGMPRGSCHTFSDGTVERALRISGSLRNLTLHEGPLAEASDETPQNSRRGESGTGSVT